MISKTNKILSSSTNRAAIRTMPNTNETEEHDIEKILAKRYNPRKKGHEYLIKWTGMPQEQNTWEPIKHIEDCKELLDIFEAQLAKQKEQRAKLSNTSSTISAASPAAPAMNSPSIVSSTPNRPVRFSKARAIDQVKAWVSSTSSHSDKYLNASPDKKRKFEESDDYDDEEEDERKNKSDQVIKRIKTINPAINDALMKAGSTGNVRITSMNKGGITTLTKSGDGTTTTVGSTIVKKIVTKPTSDVIITKDQKQQSGVFKKTGVTATPPKTGEGQVKIIDKNDSMTSGIVRISPGAKAVTRIVSKPSPSSMVVQQKPGIRTIQTIQTSTGPKGPMTKQIIQKVIQRPAAVQSPNVKIVQKQVPGQSPAARVQQVTTRTTISPKTGQPMTGGVQTVRRVAVPNKSGGQEVVTKRIVPSTQQTNTTTKVVRKVMPGGGVSQIVRTVQKEEEDDGVVDPFPKDLPPVAAGPPSPNRPLTLCPITGEVLSKAEGEKSPNLEVDDHSKTPSAPTGKAIVRKQVEKQPVKQQQKPQPPVKQPEPETQETELQPEQQQIHQFVTNEDGTPIYITGEDGTIYQVAGKNINGETILITQGSDGEQTCVLLSGEYFL